MAVVSSSQSLKPSEPGLGSAGLVTPRSREWLSSTVAEPEGPGLISVIEAPRIFISSCGTAYQRDLLQAQRIGFVLALAPQIFESVHYPSPEGGSIERYRVTSMSPTIGPVYEELGVRRYLVPVKDDTTVSHEDLRRAYSVLRQLCKESGEKGILVHCNTGRSRSVALVSALIARSNEWSLERAVREVGMVRSVSLSEEFARNVAVALEIPFEG